MINLTTQTTQELKALALAVEDQLTDREAWIDISTTSEDYQILCQINDDEGEDLATPNAIERFFDDDTQELMYDDSIADTKGLLAIAKDRIRAIRLQQPYWKLAADVEMRVDWAMDDRK